MRSLQRPSPRRRLTAVTWPTSLTILGGGFPQDLLVGLRHRLREAQARSAWVCLELRTVPGEPRMGSRASRLLRSRSLGSRGHEATWLR